MAALCYIKRTSARAMWKCRGIVVLCEIALCGRWYHYDLASSLQFRYEVFVKSRAAARKDEVRKRVAAIYTQ